VPKAQKWAKKREEDEEIRKARRGRLALEKDLSIPVAAS